MNKTNMVTKLHNYGKKELAKKHHHYFEISWLHRSPLMNKNGNEIG